MNTYSQKQPPGGVIRKRCSPVYLPHIFRTPFLKNTSGLLLLYRKDQRTKPLINQIGGDRVPGHQTLLALTTGTCHQINLWSSHARCGCCFIVCLRFHVLEIKKVDCKMSAKNWINVNKTHFVIFLDTCTHKSIKPRKGRYWSFG